VFHLAAHDPFADDRGTPALLQAARLYSRRVPVVTARPTPLGPRAADEERSEPGLTVARFGEVFGPGDRKLFRVVPATALGLFTGDATTPADGPARDFVFVRDAARACLRAAESTARGGARAYEFRSGWLLTERQMAAAVRAAYAGHPAELPDPAAPTNPLGWAPQQPLAEALDETLAWYREVLRAGAAVPVRMAA
jgi:nucleoside-diphosphate-sugar epimerase